ncbi:hypothetical protein ADE_19000 [Achromobacter denitrificans]|jgi:uroporphyrinogen decarboxylase|uniref:uroporphyrinogen decarboxylase family protein n=1 Tax=Achromobacter denitrificans TaxID=32002 RepID=UPI0016683A44|nr:uroporphyrinogen decarboxylase family protein [Achromobacter denitrificans]GFN26202.1 hypothetical protein ADE_19000 [Achromobacter denitrificans]
MNKVERIRTALGGAAPDRIPYSFWTHFPGIDLDARRLADTSAAFCADYGLDFLKAMPNGLYCVQDWGAECDFSGIQAGGVARVSAPRIRRASDWAALERLDVGAGALGRELRHLEYLLDAVGPGTPVIATVFSPMTVAAKLSGDLHRQHAAQDAPSLRRGLETIADVTGDFVRAAIGLGCAGVFFAAQDAAPDKFSAAAYAELGRPYDLQVLAAAREAGGWFNVLHMHGDDVHFDLLSAYEVSALNWHIGETPTRIEDYRRAGGTRPIVGGLRRQDLTESRLDGIRRSIGQTVAETDGRGLILTPACVIRYPVVPDTLRHAARLIREWPIARALSPARAERPHALAL